MLNINQNNEIEYVNKDYCLMQDRLKIKEKSKNQFQNVLMRVGRSRVKRGQRTNISETKKIQKILKDIFKNKIKHIKKRTIY